MQKRFREVMKLAASIKEVAKLSGVSAGTVSRAFNNYPDIKPETRERILRIAKEVGYSPTLSAKNLSSKKSSGMALILSQLLSERIGGRESDGRVFMQRTTEATVLRGLLMKRGPRCSHMTGQSSDPWWIRV